MNSVILSNEWLCTEKAHGANFSAAVAGDDQVHFAARSGLLTASDNFYGYKSQGLDVYLVPRILALRNSLVRDGFVTANDTLVVYGELCGGHYPHPDIMAVAGGVGPVQRGVWYSPALVFIAFDIAVVPVAADAAAGDGRPEGDKARTADTALPTSHPRTRFLDFDVARAASIAADLRFTQPLRRGTLAHCLYLDVRFASKIPAALGLPTLPAEHSNWAEGLVVRPVREPPPESGRGLVKRKIPEFSEKQYSHDHWRGARHGAVRSRGGVGMSWTEAETLLRYEMLAAVNQQRLDSVLSKSARVDAADKAACRRLLHDFKVDVTEALVEDGLLQPATTEHTPALQQLAVRHAPLHAELDAASRTLITKFLRGVGRRCPVLRVSTEHGCVAISPSG